MSQTERTAYAIETRDLTRRYGRLLAVDHLSLQVPRGALFGFIGPNGAGKTTTLRMLAGLLEPSAGEVWVNGQRVDHDWRATRHAIGYMPDFFGVYNDMLVWEYLDFFARCHQMPAARRKTMVDELLDLVNLTDKREANVQALSRGMQQRLCLAHALVHDPQILLLDEPASGLDPRARVEMRELLKELAAMDKTVIVSSHILAELAEMCSQVGIVEKGKLVACGSPTDIRRKLQASRVLRVRVLADESQALEFVRGGVLALGEVAGPAPSPGSGQALSRSPDPERSEGEGAVEGLPPAGEPAVITDYSRPGTTLELELIGDDHMAAALLAHLVARGAPVADFHEASNALEELFLRLTEPVST
ncbi:MAG TPA: ABC transporter ATP-binding protein [Anaerolineae bacterium]|nr:ABC transporter ATP-binding protein [Anaerolineae bacterium]